MGFGIYKPGQGYWIRTLTAGFVAAIVLAAAAWAGSQAALIHVPTPTWSAAVNQAQGTVASGTVVTLQGEVLPNATEPTTLGTATVQTIEPGRIILGQIELQDDALMTQTRSIQAVGATPYHAQVIKGSLAGIPLFEPMYLRIGAGVLVILIGAVIIYWFIYANRKTADFLIATDGEMKKVNWSTRKEIIGSTWVVVAACFLIAILLFVIDLGFSNLFKLLRVLES